MKKIICPKCGEVGEYRIYELSSIWLILDAYEEPIGATESTIVRSGKYKRCSECMSKVKIVEVEDDN